MACLSSTSLKPLTILTEDNGVPGSKFDRETEHYTVEQLKRWLNYRSMKLRGKRDELETRVSDSIRKGRHRVLDVSIDQGKWFEAKVIKENQEVIVDKSIKSKLSFVPTVPISQEGVPSSHNIFPYFLTTAIFTIMPWSLSRL